MFFALYLKLDFFFNVFLATLSFINLKKRKPSEDRSLKVLWGAERKRRGGGVATKIKETINRVRAERKQTEKKTKKVCDFSAYNFILQIWHFCFIFSCSALLYDNSIFPFLNLNN
jgi:hypothetical protein